jgi:hypothetical protein
MNVSSVTIPVGQTTSNQFDVPEMETLCAISIRSAGFTGTAITFEISFDGGATWFPVQSQDGGSVYTVTVGATARYVPLNPNVFLASHTGYRCDIRVVSNASELTNDKVIFLHTRVIE